MAWIFLQIIITRMDVYNSSMNSLPPKIVLFGILPTFVVIIGLFFSRKGRNLMDQLPLEKLHFVHILRIPVEIVLYFLFVSKAIPEIMTFEGYNFDILAGISAPIVAYFGIHKGKFNRKALLIWNFLCLALLFNIILIALFSVQSPLQKLAFDQPNIAIMYYPYSCLPTFIVPVVLFCHLVSIRQLLFPKKNWIKKRNKNAIFV